MRAEDVDRLRDRMCVELLEATSSSTALQRYRLELAHGYPAYDPDPQSNLRHLQPRDVIKRCAVCARLFLQNQQTAGPKEKRYCSVRCRLVAQQRAHRARRAAEGVA